MFSAFREPNLAARLRAAAAWPLGAYLVALLYLILYPLLSEVPRWLFEAVRADLGIGLLGGIAAGLRIAIAGPREGLDLPAAGWLAALAGGLLACGWMLVGMSFPWRM